MKKTYRLCVWMISLMMLAPFAHAQDKEKGHPLGNTKDVFTRIKKDLDGSRKRTTGQSLPLQVSSQKTFKGKVNFKQSARQSEYIIGAVEGVSNSDFFIKVSEGSLEGNIVLRNSKKAYKYSSDSDGNAFVEEVDINSVVCIEYDHANAGPAPSEPPSTGLLALTTLESLPGANGCVLLDFDGHNVTGTPWNGGNPINAQPSGMSDAAILEAWELVAEDFRPFSLNITTNEAVFNSYPRNRRMRCIITPTNTAAPGAGGVAYLNSFTWNDDTPCWVFIRTAKACGEASSHEIGHTLSLSHDGRTSPSEGYYAGHGDWAPIMGVGYYEPITHWSKGEYNNSNNKEDDLAKIAGTSNGIGYRADDHGNSLTTPRALVIGTGGAVAAASNTGLIERTGDVDVFSFTTGGGTVTLNFNPASRHANLDILVRLYNQAGTQIATANPAGLAATLSTNLASGTYYVSVDGTGYLDPVSTGYSDYGSLGYYTISGSVPATAGNQPPSVVISSPASGTSYTAPATISIAAGASDTDGTISRVEFYNGSILLGQDNTAPYSFTWTGVSAGTYSITARATDNSGAQTTSAVVSVQVNSPANQAPSVTITAPATGTSYIAPASVTINAIASDPDGSIAGVAFYNGAVLLGEDLTAPYSFTWSGVGAGTYYLTATATDNGGARDTATVIVHVTPPANQPPVVSITSPVSGTTFTTPATVTITAAASDPDGVVVRVEFYNGSTYLGEDISAPYSYTWNNPGAGNYTITARAFDIADANSSASVSFSVINPVGNYCASRGTSSRYEYIQSVSLGSISNNSGNNSGYGNFTTLSTTLIRGNSYPISFRPGFTGSIYREYWGIWIDFNQDSDFTDPGEQLASGSTSSNVTYSATFAVPATAATGTTRMRVSMKYLSSPTSCETFSFGEVEDYTIQIAAPAAAPVAETYPSTSGLPLESITIENQEEVSVHPNPAHQVVVVDQLNGDEISSGKIVDLYGVVIKTFPASGSRVEVEVDDLAAGTYVIIVNTLRGEISKKFVKI